MVRNEATSTAPAPSPAPELGFIQRNGVFYLLGVAPNGGVATHATAVNDLGDVVGYSEAGSQRRAILWRHR